MAGTHLGPYEITAPIGAGGMGEVYRACDPRLGREVAIKVLPAGVEADAERLRRFEQEARAASALNHPNIITIYDIGQTDSVHFIATEFIEGDTLRRQLTEARLELCAALEVASQVASALTAAHAAGIVHRDIKPENIMVRPDGFIKVLDFGLAKLTEPVMPKTSTPGMIDTEAPTADRIQQTEPGVVLGTVRYMSPEQARGQKVDARSDIFALGVVLYEMIAGQVPFTGETTSDVIAAILKSEPTPFSRCAPEAAGELERIVMKALRKDREERYQVMKDLLLDVKSLKQELEFAAKQPHVAPLDLLVGATAAKGSGQGTIETGQPALRQSSALSVQTTSSAEYLVNEIQRHKKGVILVLIALALVLVAFKVVLLSQSPGVLIAVALSVVLAAASSFYFLRGSKTINSLAVLPFVNTSHDPSTEYLSDGITESLIDSLAQLPKLRVMSRSAVFHYKGQAIDALLVGHKLGVQAVLTGRVAQHGHDLAINLELVQAKDNSRLWGARYHRPLTDLLAVQEEIAREITEKLRLKLSGEEERRLSKHATDNPEAYQLLLKARYVAQAFTREGWEKAITYCHQALEIEPDYAPAHAELALAYTELAGDRPPTEVLLKAKEAARRALELDETLPTAHRSLGTIKMYYDWDQVGAEREFKRALELDPGEESHRWYGWYLSLMGRLDEGLVKLKRAEAIDPLSEPNNTCIAMNFFWARRYEQAIERFQKLLELNPNYELAHSFLGEVYEQAGKFPEAFAEFQKAEQTSFGQSPLRAVTLGHAYAVSGQRDAAQKLLSELQEQAAHQYVPPVCLAVINVGLGEKEQALGWLEKAYQEHSVWLPWLKVDPRFDGLRSDPRFIDLLRRVGLQ